MAELAHGGVCPYCGTFNAFGGSKADAELSGQCGTCKNSYAIPNPSHDPGVAKIVADKDAQIDALHQELATLKAEKAPPAEPPAPAPQEPPSAVS